MQAKQLKSSLIHSQNGLFEQTVTVKNLLTRKPSLLIFAISCVLAASVWVIAPSIHNHSFRAKILKTLPPLTPSNFIYAAPGALLFYSQARLSPYYLR